LADQRGYVSGVLAKMRSCNKAHGTSSVKIGITGTGQQPYYRIFSSEDGDVENEKIYGSFYDYHKPFDDIYDFKQSDNWSNLSMTFDELLNFYADAIGFKGKRA